MPRCPREVPPTFKHVEKQPPSEIQDWTLLGIRHNSGLRGNRGQWKPGHGMLSETQHKIQLLAAYSLLGVWGNQSGYSLCKSSAPWATLGQPCWPQSTTTATQNIISGSLYLVGVLGGPILLYIYFVGHAHPGAPWDSCAGFSSSQNNMGRVCAAIATYKCETL